MTSRGDATINQDTTIEGRISNGGRVEIYGLVLGEVETNELIIHEGGRFVGHLTANSSNIFGEFKGEARVKNLISIGATGVAEGDIQYGALALSPEGRLDADIRNLPPELFGDMHITVRQGQSVPVRTSDLRAVDPDDVAQELSFQVSNATRGHLSYAESAQNPLSKFTQADLEAGRVLFVHDGQAGETASFDVFVVDAEGATSGQPKTVKVAVRAG